MRYDAVSIGWPPYPGARGAARGVELAEIGQEVERRPAGAVELPDDDRCDLAALRGGEDLEEPGSRVVGAAAGLLDAS